MEYPCSICEKQVSKRGIFCNICDKWVHPKCNQLNPNDYEKLVKSENSEVWSCLKCNCSIFPMNNIDELNDYNLILPDDSQLFSEINSNIDYDKKCQVDKPYIFENNEQCPIIRDVNCRYYDISKFNSLPLLDYLSFLHLNISSISKHYDNFNVLLDSIKHQFKAIGISETRISLNNSNINFDLPGYHSFHTPTESLAGGTALFLANSLNTKSRKDLDNVMYFPKLLESTFAEITSDRHTNIIVGCIYKHPSMAITNFNDFYLTPLLDKACREGKVLILLGDFNIDLLKTSLDKNVSEFLDNLGNYLLSPQIIIPTRVNSNSKTLIDNIFLSPTNLETLSGNLTVGISDHLPQFLLLKKSVSSFLVSDRNNNVGVKDWKKFDHINFKKEFKNNDWDKVFIENKDPDTCFDIFYNTFSALLDKHVPTKKLSKTQIKSSLKPWITKGIKKSIQKRDNILKKYIRTRNENRKEILYNQYKNYRNNVVKLIRISKKNYHKEFFNKNINNNKKI